MVIQPHVRRVGPSAKGHLPRPRPLAKLGGSLSFRLTLLSAPAGAGKTTLLRDFVASLSLPSFYFQLDRSHRDPALLARRLLQGLGASVEPIESREDLPQTWKIQGELARLARALVVATQDSHSELVLIVDDYHNIEGSDGAGELFLGLLDMLPSGVHLVIASRSVPSLPLARLRLEGELLELGQDDLALDARELSELLELEKLDLSEEEEKLVLDRTRGWIAGISILVQSARTRAKGEMIAFLRDFSGDSALVYDYFAEEVLRQQDHTVQRFLMATSLLGELHRDVVNPLLEITDAQSVLEKLAASNVFIAPLDEGRDCYRYHPLFREFLRARAKRSLGQEELSRLHERAARLYEARRNWRLAIDHLCEAGKSEEAATIIEREAEAYLEMGYLETVGRWLSLMPEQTKRERPHLIMIEGMVARGHGRYQEALSLLTRVQTLFAERGETNHLTTVASERAMVSYRLRNYREAVDLLEYTLATVPEGAKRALTLARLCTNYKELGELERAVRFGEAALKALERLASSESERHLGLGTRALRYLAETHILRGDLDRALSLLLRADDLFSEEQLGDLEVAYVACALGIIRVVRGEADLALAAFKKVEGHGASYVEPQRRRMNLWKGNLLVDLGDFAGAEECYQLAGFPVAERAWLHIRRHQPGRAILLAREALEESLESAPLRKATLTAVLGLGLGASGQEDKAISLLGEAEAIFTAHGYAHHLASLRLHISQLLLQTQETERADALLRETLKACESFGFKHFYWWDPNLLAHLLASVIREEEFHHFVESVVEKHQSEVDREVLAGLASTGEVETPAVADLRRLLESCSDRAARARIEKLGADPLVASSVLRLQSAYGLTWREIEVFVTYYLDRRFSKEEGHGRVRKELADELCMTENTLKSHVSRIRRKLDLPDRADSLQVYRMIVDQDSAHPARPVAQPQP